MRIPGISAKVESRKGVEGHGKELNYTAAVKLDELLSPGADFLVLREASEVIAKAIADDYMALHGQELLAAIKPEAVLNLVLAQVASVLGDKLKDSLK